MVYLYDTFSGFGRIEDPNSRDWGDEHHKQDILVIGLQEVKDCFKKFGLLLESVVFVKGDVCETAKKHPDTPIAILRLDVDLYDPTTAALQSLF